MLNLWRGNLMNIMRIFPQAATDFASFDYLRRLYYVNDGSWHSWAVLFGCGAVAGIVSTSLVLPIDFLRYSANRLTKGYVWPWKGIN